MIYNHYSQSWLRIGMKPNHIRGLVLGSHVFYTGNRYEVDACAGLRAHEEKHVEQYQRFGFAGFLARYVWAFITGVVRYRSIALAYWWIPLEVEARNAEGL